MRLLALLALLVFFLLLFSREIHAVTVTINNYTSSISSEIFNVEASISGATNATNYLRIDLYKENTTNYFGETYNGSDWYFGSDGKNYFRYKSKILQHRQPSRHSWATPVQALTPVREHTK